MLLPLTDKREPRSKAEAAGDLQAREFPWGFLHQEGSPFKAERGTVTVPLLHLHKESVAASVRLGGYNKISQSDVL